MLKSRCVCGAVTIRASSRSALSHLGLDISTFMVDVACTDATPLLPRQCMGEQ